jgi:hypothetical protein
MWKRGKEHNEGRFTFFAWDTQYTVGPLTEIEKRRGGTSCREDIII